MTFRWIVAFALITLWIPTLAQRGRAFVSIEAHVGTARAVHVGFVKDPRPMEYTVPKDGFYPGKPFKVTFTVSETIKGTAAKSLDLYLTLQHTFEFEYLRDHKIEIMLVETNQYIDEEAEIGLEGPGSRYSFRILQKITHPKNNPDTAWIAERLNNSNDEGRMFDLTLSVVSRRAEILKRARSFAKKHPEVLHAFHLHVPNEFAAKCGSTNAYCMITLPLCAESKKLMLGLLKDPGRLLVGVPNKDLDWQRKSVADSVRSFLSQFDKHQ